MTTEPEPTSPAAPADEQSPAPPPAVPAAPAAPTAPPAPAAPEPPVYWDDPVSEAQVTNPCIGICMMDESGYCIGCGRGGPG